MEILVLLKPFLNWNLLYIIYYAGGLNFPEIVNKLLELFPFI